MKGMSLLIRSFFFPEQDRVEKLAYESVKNVEESSASEIILESEEEAIGGGGREG